MGTIYYQWIPSDGCEVCNAMEGIYLEMPQRPHPNCKCTILEIDPANLPGWCVWDEPLLVSLTTGVHEIVYNTETNLYDQLILEFVFTILCRDGTTIEGTWRYEDEDPDLPFGPDDNDSYSWTEVVTDRAERVALDYAESHCPACKSSESNPSSPEA